MVDFGEVMDKMNIKELIAIMGGMVGSRFIDSLMVNMDANKRDAIKVVGGLAATYLLNDMAEKKREYRELFALAGLATTTIAATPVADRVSIQVSKHIGTPVKIVASPKVVNASPNPKPAASVTPKKAIASI